MQKRRPTLLVLSSTYPRWRGDHEPGFVHELSRRLCARFRVIVLCPHAPGASLREEMDGVEVVRYRYAPRKLQTLVNDGGIIANLRRAPWKLFLMPGFVLAQAWLALLLLRKEGVDVIHAHWLLPQGLIAVVLRSLSRRRVPFVVTSHGADLYALKGRVLNRIKVAVVRRAAAVTVVSSAMRDVLRLLDPGLKNVRVVSMGVDMLERFRPDPSTLRSDGEILFVGRLVEKKGLRHLLDAMPRVLRDVPDAYLSIAGFGPEEAALRAQVERLGLSGRVRFLGAVPQSELPELYRRAALFVAPFVRADSGDQEGLGLVLVEALGCRCPVIAGNVPAVQDVLGDAPGTMVQADDATALAHAIIANLADPVSARRQADSLHESVNERFDWSHVSACYAALLTKAASGEACA